MLDNLVDVAIGILVVFLVLVIWLSPAKVSPVNGRRKFKKKEGRKEEWY